MNIFKRKIRSIKKTRKKIRKKIRRHIRNLNAMMKNQGFFQRIGTLNSFVFRLIWWRLYGKSATERERRHPAKVKDNKIVFESYGDYGDNARALSEYMAAHGYNSKYDLVWLVDNPRKYRRFIPSGIRVVKRKLTNGQFTLKALKEIHSAKYVFYTVNVNWAKIAQNDQIFVDLWHGCSFKDNQSKRRIFFDYIVLASPFFTDIKQKYWDCSTDKLLSLGYPRYDVLKSGTPKSAKFMNTIRKKKKYDKIIFWMPTFRKSRSASISVNTLDDSSFNLPIAMDRNDMKKVNAACKENNVLLVIKRHRLHNVKNVNTALYSNIDYIDDEVISKKNLELYGLLHETDALITDYSSVGIDYMLLDKPIGYTLDDYEGYMESRGFSIDNVIDYMPGNHIYNLDEFIEFISEVSKGEDKHKAERDKVASEILIESDSYCQSLLDHLGLNI